MDRPVPPINQPVGDKPLPAVWQAYFKALDAYIKYLEARITALEP